MAKKLITRRSFIKSAGAITILVAAGTVWRASEQGVFSVGEGPAYAPWRDWRGDGKDLPLNLVRAAILASNAHNAQPWLFHISENAIQIYADPNRNIGAMDSLRREMYISLGCALENLCLAAPVYGFDITLRLMPEKSDPSYVAHAALARAEQKLSPLFNAIPLRHTDRSAFDTARPIGKEALEALSGLKTSPDTRLQWFTDTSQCDRIGQQTVQATKAITQDEEMSSASARWFRSNWADIQQHRDGITLDAQGMTPLMTSLGKIAPPVTTQQADSIWLQTTREKQTATAGAYGIISIADFSDKSQLLEAGRLWQRLHLAATTQKQAMQPLNQIIERVDREEQQGLNGRFKPELQRLVGEKPWRGVFLFRIGYPLRISLPSPRRSVQQVLI